MLQSFIYNEVARRIRKGMKIDTVNTVKFVFNYAADDLGIHVGTVRAGRPVTVENPKKIKVSEHGSELDEMLVSGIRSKISNLKELVIVVHDIDYKHKQATSIAAYINENGEKEKFTETNKF